MPTTHQPVAIVTGASSGIGRAVTEQLSTLGWRLVVCARDAAKLNSIATTPNVRIVAGDVGKPEISATLVNSAIDAFGSLDAIVCNAGTAPLMPIAETTDEVFAQCFDINVMGTARLIRECWPIFVQQHHGRIVCTSSMASVDPFPGFFAYAASKAAVNSLVRSCMNEGREHGIEAYSVAPGAVDTPMLRSLFDETMLPPSHCLTADAVANVIVGCVTGQRAHDAGTPILLSAN
ncbi:MAG: SDR family oxidoreductase [Phycisphaeraceae bacterium]|nr:SDR family oxidoreductase [Phycisphaerales bacterium]MCB9859061.1 SDR family oxidoreductase [Phycisphaeraceae bacterium]